MTLLSKLDRDASGDASGDSSACTLIKRDNQHPVYPQTMKEIEVVAVEDHKYYIDRQPGDVHHKD